MLNRGIPVLLIAMLLMIATLPFTAHERGSPDITQVETNDLPILHKAEIRAVIIAPSEYSDYNYYEQPTARDQGEVTLQTFLRRIDEVDNRTWSFFVTLLAISAILLSIRYNPPRERTEGIRYPQLE